MIIKKVIAPVRIDFAGGTTDIEPFASKYNGSVLNASINKYITGELFSSSNKVGLKYSGDIPTSSGLGTSGVMTLVWLSLISKEKDKINLAEKVYEIEKSMGIIGGKQDQYAGALGGINFIEFGGGKVKITKLKLSEKIIKRLEKNLVLVYTGKPHYSSDLNSLAINNLNKKTVESLKKIRDIAKSMKNALLNEDLDKFAMLMNEETKQRKKLHKKIIPRKTEKIIQEGMNHGAIAAKVCGAGGGGSILFFGNKEKLKKKFNCIDFKFDFSGLKISE